MKVIALISGGKDSCFNMMHCVANNHEIIAIANLHPPIADGVDEIDSFMYQSVGHEIINHYAECLDVPLFRQEISGTCITSSCNYTQTSNDEVEDLFKLLSRIKHELPHADAISTGAILSNYQRIRVENVCSRLGLTSLAYLWNMNQDLLMQSMIECDLNSVLIKVASIGLNQSHLGKSIKDMYTDLSCAHEKYGVHICGEGGEYETLTLDCPLFVKKIVIDQVKLITHSDDAFAPVCYIKIIKSHLETKQNSVKCISDRLSPEYKQKLISSGQKIMNNYSQISNSEIIPSLPTGLIKKSITHKHAKKMHYFHHNTYLVLSGLSITDLMDSPLYLSSPTVEEEINVIMKTIENLLSKCNLSWNNVTLIHVYVSDMSLFSQINAKYASFFSNNPPPRVTVQANISERIQIDLIAKHFKKDTLHVQSISYWAAANIGPYAQACTCEGDVFLAGQIGLTPNSMILNEDINIQIFESKKNLNAVITEVKSKAIGAVCYVTNTKYVELVKNANENIALLVVGVPCLPRNSLVELQATAINSEFKSSKVKITNPVNDKFNWDFQQISSPQMDLIYAKVQAQNIELLSILKDAFENVLEIMKNSVMGFVISIRIFHIHCIPEIELLNATRKYFNLAAITLVPVDFIENDHQIGIICQSNIEIFKEIE